MDTPIIIAEDTYNSGTNFQSLLYPLGQARGPLESETTVRLNGRLFASCLVSKLARILVMNWLDEAYQVCHSILAHTSSSKLHTLLGTAAWPWCTATEPSSQRSHVHIPWAAGVQTVVATPFPTLWQVPPKELLVWVKPKQSYCLESRCTTIEPLRRKSNPRKL